jgi:hypothetical protein
MNLMRLSVPDSRKGKPFCPGITPERGHKETPVIIRSTNLWVTIFCTLKIAKHLAVALSLAQKNDRWL